MRGVYRITNKNNGKFYIGSSIDIENRFCTHRYELRRGCHRNLHLQNAWNKHGEASFLFEVIEAMNDDSETAIRKREQRHLRRTRCFDRLVGYNISPTVDNNQIPVETRIRMSVAAKGKKKSPESCVKMSLAAKGRAKSPEHRAKIAAALRGRRVPAAVKLKMSVAAAGRQISPEHQAKITASLRGRKLTSEHKYKIGSAIRLACQRRRLAS